MPAVFVGYRVGSQEEPDRRAKAKVVDPVPYVTPLEDVFVVDPTNPASKVNQFVRPSDGSSKSPVAVRVRNYFEKAHPGAWDDKITDPARKLLIIGFQPKLLFQLMALEASMPFYAKPLSPSAWLWHQRFLDIGETILPKECAGVVTLADAVKRRRYVDKAEGEQWDAMLKDWDRPGVNPQADAWLACSLASQLGIPIGG